MIPRPNNRAERDGGSPFRLHFKRRWPAARYHGCEPSSSAMKQSIPRWSPLLDGVQVGLAFGLVMALLVFTGLAQTGLLGVLNALALWTVRAWCRVGLPPRGPMAIVVVAPVMILIQWSIAGLLVGLGRALKFALKVDKR